MKSVLRKISIKEKRNAYNDNWRVIVSYLPLKRPRAVVLWDKWNKLCLVRVEENHMKLQWKNKQQYHSRLS